MHAHTPSSHSVTMLLAQISCTQTQVLPLALRELVLADLCSALGFFVDQSCQPIEGRLVLTNQTVPVCLWVRSLFFEERRRRAGTLSTGFIPLLTSGAVINVVSFIFWTTVGQCFGLWFWFTVSAQLF